MAPRCVIGSFLSLLARAAKLGRWGVAVFALFISISIVMGNIWDSGERVGGASMGAPDPSTWDWDV